MTPMIKSVELPTGVKLPYVEQGDPSGVPVLLLHGVADSWRSFERILPHLPPSIHAFALTQRGHGDASKPTGDYTIEILAADLADFMDTRSFGPAVIVGHSMGSAVAHRLAFDHPEHTQALVLMSSRIALRSGFREFWDSTLSKLTDPIDPDFVRGMIIGWSSPAQPVPNAFLETMVQESLKMPAHVWRAIFAGALDYDFSWMLHPINVPTLLIWGGQDASIPQSDQEALAAAIVGSRIMVYPGAGHSPHWEEPDHVASDLVAFIEDLGN